MARADVLERVREGGVVFDGALGTMLIAKGLRLGRPPEEWNRERPSVVEEIHLWYLESGAEVIETNTFGASPSRLGSFGLGGEIGELNTRGVEIARTAVAKFDVERGSRLSRRGTVEDHPAPRRERFVALSIGPTGKMLPPVGRATEKEIREEFAGQLQAINAPYDLVLFETMFDLNEALLGLSAAKELADTPVAVTLTFAKNPRGFFTIMGNEATRAVRELEGAGADVVGANCTITSDEMIELGRILRGGTGLPVLCQPNAGKPRVRDGVPVYDQTPEEFARDVLVLFDLGINAIGGCCGTTPAFIREVSAAVSKQ